MNFEYKAAPRIRLIREMNAFRESRWPDERCVPYLEEMSLTMFNKPPTETQSIASDRPMPAYNQFRPMPPPTAITIQPLPRPMETFEVNALVCNVIALVCMPCACACAIPGLLCGMAAYVEYRVFDTMAYLRRLRWSRNLAIASTIFGLVCMVSIAVVIYLHYNEIKRYLKRSRLA